MKNILDSKVVIIPSQFVEHIILFLELNVEEEAFKCPFLSMLTFQECFVFKYELLLYNYFHLYSFLIKVTCYICISIFYPDIQYFLRQAYVSVSLVSELTTLKISCVSYA